MTLVSVIMPTYKGKKENLELPQTKSCMYCKSLVAKDFVICGLTAV